MRFIALAFLVACSDGSNVRELPDAPIAPDSLVDDAPDVPVDVLPIDAPEIDAACSTDLDTDPMNCGRCDRVCGGSSTCSMGTCSAQLVLDPNVTSNFCGAAFTIDQIFVITCWGSGFSEVRRAPLDGSNTVGTQVAVFDPVPVVAMRGILIDGDSVYYGLEGNPSNVYSYKTDGTATPAVAFADDTSVRFSDLQLVGDTYYWIDNAHTAGEVAPSIIKKRAKTDTTDTVLATVPGTAYHLQVTATQLVWGEARASTVAIYAAPLAGAPTPADITTVAATASGTHVTRIGEIVYWADKSATGAIKSWDTASATPAVQTIAANLAAPEGLLGDGTHLYFKQADAMYRVAATGTSAPEQLSPTVAAHDTQATSIWGADAQYVYWAAGPGFGDSKIYRVAK